MKYLCLSASSAEILRAGSNCIILDSRSKASAEACEQHILNCWAVSYITRLVVTSMLKGVVFSFCTELLSQPGLSAEQSLNHSRLHQSKKPNEQSRRLIAGNQQHVNMLNSDTMHTFTCCLLQNKFCLHGSCWLCTLSLSCRFTNHAYKPAFIIQTLGSTKMPIK